MLTPLQPAVLAAMRDPPHSYRSADSYAGRSSVSSNRPCSPLCPIILTPFQSAARQLCRTLLIPLQPAVLTAMPDHPHSLPAARADRFAGPPSLLPTGHADSYAGPRLAHFQPAVLTVMPDHPISTPTGRADRYSGPFSPPFNRPCCRYDGSCSLHCNRPF